MELLLGLIMGVGFIWLILGSPDHNKRIEHDKAIREEWRLRDEKYNTKGTS